MPVTTMHHGPDGKPFRDMSATFTLPSAAPDGGAEAQQEAPKGGVLHRMKYHVFTDENGETDWELFEPSVNCDTCIDVLIVRANPTQATKGKAEQGAVQREVIERLTARLVADGDLEAAEAITSLAVLALARTATIGG